MGASAAGVDVRGRRAGVFLLRTLSPGVSCRYEVRMSATGVAVEYSPLGRAFGSLAAVKNEQVATGAFCARYGKVWKTHDTK